MLLCYASAVALCVTKLCRCQRVWSGARAGHPVVGPPCACSRACNIPLQHLLSNLPQNLWRHLPSHLPYLLPFWERARRLPLCMSIALLNRSRTPPYHNRDAPFHVNPHACMPPPGAAAPRTAESTARPGCRVPRTSAGQPWIIRGTINHHRHRGHDAIVLGREAEWRWRRRGRRLCYPQWQLLPCQAGPGLALGAERSCARACVCWCEREWKRRRHRQRRGGGVWKRDDGAAAAARGGARRGARWVL